MTDSVQSLTVKQESGRVIILKPRPGRKRICPYPIIGKVKEDLRPGEQAPTGTSRTVQLRKLNTSAKVAAKGDTILVGDQWYDFMKLQMTQKAWELWGTEPYFYMKNIVDKWADPEGHAGVEPQFVCQVMSLNFVCAYYFQNEFARLVAMDSRHFDTRLLTKEANNHFTEPWLYHKGSTHTTIGGGKVGLVGNEQHMYNPLLYDPRDGIGVFIEKGFVEWFPDIPMLVTYNGVQHSIDGYCLEGQEVWGHTDEIDVPLQIFVNGKLEWPCPEWISHEAFIPPEYRNDWK